METLVKLNDQLMGAPSGILIGIFAIALGYVLKTIPSFNNKYIPLVVVLGCTVGFMFIAPPNVSNLDSRIYWGRNLFFGFIIGFGAWTFHAQILRRWIDPKLFAQSDQPDSPAPPKTP